MGIKKDIGFTLKAFDFRETSKIVHIFTKNNGKIHGLFKGLRAGKKNFTTSLDSFSLNELIFYESKNEMWLVSSADMIDNFSFLKENVEKNIIASYIVELVDKINPLHLPSIKVFNLVNDSLRGLEDNIHKKVIYIFQIRILEISGFRPHLTACVRCSKEVEKKAFFSINLGGVLCASCLSYDKLAKELSPDVIASLKYIQNNDFRLSLRLNLSPLTQRVILEILEEFLGYHLDTRLKSLSSMAVFSRTSPEIRDGAGFRQ
ncbi:DNA repair protein RecO [Candidatus Omnitrophota bacterium]